jgi:hypothetical protein
MVLNRNQVEAFDAMKARLKHLPEVFNLREDELMNVFAVLADWLIEEGEGYVAKQEQASCELAGRCVTEDAPGTREDNNRNG